MQAPALGCTMTLSATVIGPTYQVIRGSGTGRRGSRSKVSSGSAACPASWTIQYGRALPRKVLFQMLTSWVLLTLIASLVLSRNRLFAIVEVADSSREMPFCLFLRKSLPTMSLSETDWSNHSPLPQLAENRLSRTVRPMVRVILMPPAAGE